MDLGLRAIDGGASYELGALHSQIDFKPRNCCTRRFHIILYTRSRLYDRTQLSLRGYGYGVRGFSQALDFE